MGVVKFIGWNKKPKTMLRFIKPGDIFCFLRGTETYCFGRIMTKASLGHFGEIFAYASIDPLIPEEEVLNGKRLLGPLCLDSYTSFDRKTLGDWRIIGHQEDYRPDRHESIYFAYGVAGSCKRIDIFGGTTSIAASEASQYPRYTSYSDPPIQKMLDNLDFPSNQLVAGIKT